MRPLTALLTAALFACGEESPRPPALPTFTLSARNAYAVSLFSLTVTPTAPAPNIKNAPGALTLEQQIQPWSSTRVESGDTLSTGPLTVPHACDVTWEFSATSLGMVQRFKPITVRVAENVDVRAVYDFDLATADFDLNYTTAKGAP